MFGRIGGLQQVPALAVRHCLTSLHPSTSRHPLLPPPLAGQHHSAGLSPVTLPSVPLTPQSPYSSPPPPNTRQDNTTVQNGGNRHTTVLVYLSDVEDGGETVFPLLPPAAGQEGDSSLSECAAKHLAVKPRKGTGGMGVQFCAACLDTLEQCVCVCCWTAESSSNPCLLTAVLM